MSSFFVVLASMEPVTDTITQIYERPFRLNGDWEVALTHLQYDEKLWPLFVFCDVVEYTYVNGSRMRFLDLVNSTSLRNESPVYVKVVKKRFSSININIRKDLDYDHLTSQSGITCVLHFRKV